MKLLQAKLDKYQEPQKAKAAGIYPYFRAISSEQDPEVIINGRKVMEYGYARGKIHSHLYRELDKIL